MKGRCKTQIQVSLILSAILMVALGATTVFATNYYVATDGDDQDPGTLAEPFATIQHAADVMSAGDTCYIRAGSYYETVVETTDSLDGTAENPITFTNYQEEVVTLDGTEAITGAWTQHSGNIYKTTLSEDIWQLFVDGEMMISARWPNSTWDEHWYDNTYWGYAANNSSNGTMVDLPHDSVDLAGENKSFQGAKAILNVGYWKTWVRTINSHSSGSATFTYDTVPADFYKGLSTQKPYHRYFIEGCDLDLLDSEKEWHYDYTGNVLYLWAPGGGSPSGTIKGKTQTYAFDIQGNDYLNIKGLNFFGTTIRFQGCTNLIVDECNFKYPSYSKRMLGSVDEIELTWITHADLFTQSNCVFKNNTVEYTDGPAILMSGTDNTIENNYFHEIDYSVVNINENCAFSIHTQWCPGITYRRNTLRSAGASNGFRGGADDEGDTNLCEYNYHTRCCLLQYDGATFQLPPAAADYATLRYNWVNDSGDYGIRLDGKVGKDKWSEHALTHHNVTWDLDDSGLRIKGDYQETYNNTARACTNVDIPIWDENQLDGTGNVHSTTRNNAANEISGDKYEPERAIPGTDSNNWTGYITTQMRDPVNWDFRPKQSSDLVDAGYVISGVTDGYLGSAPDIGAYEYGETNYWIGGCRFKKASMPVPPVDGSEVKTDADLMWLGGRDATQYRVNFGTTSPGTFQGTQSNNIYDPGTLSVDTTYYWRIDTVTASDTVTGDVWSFYTGVTGGTTIDYNSAADTFVSQPSPSSNYGSQASMRIQGIDKYYGYVKFIVDQTGASSSSAIFKMKTYTTAPENTTVYSVTGDWDESTLTWNNSTLSWGSSLDSKSSISASTWYEFDVSSGVSGDGTYTFGLKTTQDAAGLRWWAKESGDIPVLTVISGGGAPDTTPPATPAGLAATPGDSLVSLDWNDNTESDLDGYNVYSSIVSGYDFSKINESLVTTSDYTDTTVTNDTTYYYRVSAVDTSSNESNLSSEVNALPQGDTTPPAAPTGLDATPGDSQVALDWDDNTEGDLDGYNVYRSTTSGSGFSKINGSLVSPSDYTDSTASNDTTYYYKVTAVDVSENESGYSSEVSATPSGPPAAPSNLTATAVSPNQIDLEWVDNSGDEDGFKIECSEDDNNNFEQIDTVGANVTTYNSTGLKKNTTFYYRVRAYNGGGDSSYSNEAYDTTPKK